MNEQKDQYDPALVQPNNLPLIGQYPWPTVVAQAVLDLVPRSSATFADGMEAAAVISENYTADPFGDMIAAAIRAEIKLVKR